MIQSILWQIPWFGIFSGLIWYGKKQTLPYLENTFGIQSYEKIATFLAKRTEVIAETLSMSNPLKYADYIGALSSSALAAAKAGTVRQTINFLNDLMTGGLELIWIIGCIYCFIRIIRHYQAKTTENDIADAVIAKLTPLLEEIKNQK